MAMRQTRKHFQTQIEGLPVDERLALLAERGSTIATLIQSAPSNSPGTTIPQPRRPVYIAAAFQAAEDTRMATETRSAAKAAKQAAAKKSKGNKTAGWKAVATKKAA